MRVILLTSAITLGFVSFLSAAEPLTDQKVEITGSHIKQVVHKIGFSVDTVAPVYVFDREFIERTGGATVAEVLRKIPQARIHGF